MPNKVFVNKGCECDYNNPLRKKNRNKKTVLMTKSFNQKSIAFSAERICDVDKKHPNHSKGVHKLVPYLFRNLF